MTLMLVDDDIEMIEMMSGLVDWTNYGYDRAITAARRPFRRSEMTRWIF